MTEKQIDTVEVINERGEKEQRPVDCIKHRGFGPPQILPKLHDGEEIFETVSGSMIIVKVRNSHG